MLLQVIVPVKLQLIPSSFVPNGVVGLEGKDRK